MRCAWIIRRPRTYQPAPRTLLRANPEILQGSTENFGVVHEPDRIRRRSQPMGQRACDAPSSARLPDVEAPRHSCGRTDSSTIRVSRNSLRFAKCTRSRCAPIATRFVCQNRVPPSHELVKTVQLNPTHGYASRPRTDRSLSGRHGPTTLRDTTNGFEHWPEEVRLRGWHRVSFREYRGSLVGSSWACSRARAKNCTQRAVLHTMT